MKKFTVILILLFLIFVSFNASAVYLPEEITNEMVEKWIEEAEEYRSESSIQSKDTNHEIQELLRDSEEEIIGFNMISFMTVAREIIEEAHKKHRKYKEPSVENLLKKRDREPELVIAQSVMAEGNRAYRDTDDMHLVFKVISNNDEEVIIQPKRTIETDEGYQSQLHIGIKVYEFSYDKFPSHQEYIDGDYDISAIFISYSGESELDIPWDEIR